jgi:hypothetical protein
VLIAEPRGHVAKRAHTGVAWGALWLRALSSPLLHTEAHWKARIVGSSLRALCGSRTAHCRRLPCELTTLLFLRALVCGLRPPQRAGVEVVEKPER